MKTYDERFKTVMKRINSNEKKENVMKKKIIITAVTVAAAVALCTAGFFVIKNLKTPETGGSSSGINIIEKHVVREEDTGIEAGEIAMLEDWDRLIDPCRYLEVEFHGRTYVSKLIAVHEDHQGDPLGEGEAVGQDYKTDEIKKTTVKVGKVIGMSEEVAITVRFNDEDQYPYAYVCPDYVPDNLGDFIDKLNLYTELDTKLCYYEGGGDPVVFEDVDMPLIWSYLLNDAMAVNEPNREPGRKVIEMTATINVLGYHNHAMWLTEDGYLCTNLLETGKYFYIGKEKVEAFQTEVFKHQAYRYIYDVVSSNEEPELLKETGVENNEELIIETEVGVTE